MKPIATQPKSERPEILQLIEVAKDRTRKRQSDQAIAGLLDHVEGKIQYHCYRYLRLYPYLEYEDLRQAAIIGVIQQIKTYDPLQETLFSNWAKYGIQSELKALREAGKKNGKSVDSCFENLNPVSIENPLDVSFFERVLARIAHLPEQTQQIIQWKLEGWQYTEIAELVGKSADAVRMTFNRAIAGLQRVFFPEPVVESIPICFEESGLVQKVVRKLTHLQKVLHRTLRSLMEDSSELPKLCEAVQQRGLENRAGERAMALILERYTPWVNSKVRQYSGLPSEGVRSCCYHALQRAAESFTPSKGSFDSWLYWHFSGQIKPLLNARKRHYRTDQMVAQPPSSFDQDVIYHPWLDLALSSLTEEERAILHLRFWQDYSLSEIASTLGLPKSSVGYQVSRILSSLRAAFLLSARWSSTSRSSRLSSSIQGVL